MGKKKVAQPAADTAAAENAAATETAKTVPVKRGKHIARGRIYITASYNNTVISATDDAGNLLAWSTAGALGFSGPKKATPFAASKIVSVIAEKLKGTEMAEVDIFVKGVGGGRDSAIRSFINQGFNVVSIRDVTPVPHNGPRPPKVRRV